MDVILKILSEQWIYMLLAAFIVGGTFVIKKFKPDIYTTYCKCALIATSVVLVILAIFFHQQDLFLLVPVVVLCCEMFGYDITGKIVAVLFADFIVIMLINLMSTNGLINEVIDNILFYVLQIIVAIGIGFLLDKHIRVLQAEKKKKKEAALADADTANEKNDNAADDTLEHRDFIDSSNIDDEEIDMDSLNEKINSFLNDDIDDINE